MPPTLKQATDTATADSAIGSSTMDAPRKDLERVLKRMSSVADRKSHLPILGYVRVRTDGASATFTATDLDITLTITTPWIGDRFAFCTPVKPFADSVAKMSAGTVRIKRYGELSVEAGGAMRRLESVSEREFPTPPNTELLRWKDVPADVLLDLFERTASFMSEDAVRPHLQGVLFESRGDVVVTVATDGHRLTKMQRPLDGCPAFPAGVIVPSKGVHDLVKLLKKATGTCQLAVTRTHFFVRHAEATLTIKLIDAEFPKYEQVIPKDNQHCFSVDRTEILAALKRAKVFCDDKLGVKLSIGNGYLALKTDGTSESLVACGELAERDREYTIGFNPNYLIEAIDEIDCVDVSFTLGGELDPAVIRSTTDACNHTVEGSTFVAVIMPMRI